MVNGLDALLDVHRHDSRLAAIEAELATFPEARERAAQARERTGKDVEQATARLEEAEREQRRLEGALLDQEALTVRLDGQTLEVKSNQAYQILLHEIENSKKSCSELETRILELLDQVDASRSALDAARTRARDTEARGAELEAKITEREAGLESERAQLAAARAEHAERVEAGLLSRYERIAARTLPALAAVAGGACGICHMAVPRQRGIEIEREEALFSCPGCHRLLLPGGALEAHAPTE
ncbi:MAG: hypothetical protein O7A09_07910 [Proteobacteria bacterium]|nr:hypothetical protein [Pseudomonadota bacterium]